MPALQPKEEVLVDRCNVDRYSGKVLSTVNITQVSLGKKLANGMDIVHFGLFGGLFSRVLYFFVGLMPTILLITGFVMWRYRKPVMPQATVREMARQR